MMLCLWYTYNNVGWVYVWIHVMNWYKYNKKVAIVIFQEDYVQILGEANSSWLINTWQTVRLSQT